MNPITLLVTTILTIGYVKTDNILVFDEDIIQVSVKALHAFLYDQRVVSIIMSDRELDTIAYQTYRKSLYNTHHFTFYDFRISNMTTEYQLPGTEKGITPHSSTHSYLITSEILLGREGLIKNLFRQNPNAKWGIIITKEVDDDGLLRFYRKYWKLYKMAFLMTIRNKLSIEAPTNLITNISYARSDKVIIYQFNPFLFNDDGERGKLIVYDTSKITTKEDWSKIFYFYRTFMDNLHEYTLKVVLTDDGLLMGTVSESEEKYKYPDGELVMTLMKKMNFKMERHLFGDDHLGAVLDNGTITGVTAKLEYDLVDIIGNSRLMTDIGK